MLKTLITLVAAMLCVATTHAQLTTPVLVGYWHNWNDVNAKYIDIDSVDSRYNVIPVAFAIPTSNTDMTMTFTPDRGTVQQLKERIQRQQDKGKKVLISVGGATAYVDLTTEANRDAFVTSMMSIITTYGFDGVDIDIEHGRSILIEGGTIADPQNIAQIHLIEAIRTIMDEYRSTYDKKMILTFAPETAYVQGGMSGFGSIWGGYLPILDALRDSLDLLHVQLYNSGTMYGIDTKIYTQGTADFIVAMTEAVIQGFTARTGGAFEGLPAYKVAVGLPASTNAAGGGYVDSATIDSAVTYLRKGGTKPGTYTLANANGYEDLAGMMTWSINWDSVGANGKRYPYASVYHALFGTPPLPAPDQVFLIAPLQDENLTMNTTTLRWYAGTPQIASYHVEVREGTKIVVTDTTVSDTTFSMPQLTPATTYTWRVRARNATGWGTWSVQRVFRSLPYPYPVALRSPQQMITLNTTAPELVWGKATPYVTDYRLQLLDKANRVVVDSVTVDTTWKGSLDVASTYTWRVQARNVSGWGPWSDTWSFSTVPFPDTVRIIAPVHATRHTEDTLTLQWHTAAPWVVSYDVEVLYNNALMYADSTITDTTVTLTNLGCCGTYTWRVRARNLAGRGQWTTPHTFTVVPVPSQVEIISPRTGSSVNVDSLVVTWKQAEPMVDVYHLQVMQELTSSMIVNDDTTYTSTSAPLIGLDANRIYTMRVRARNVSGWGPWSSVVAVTLTKTDITSVGPETPPTQPLRVYPNPAREILTIDRAISAQQLLTITDMQGVRHYERTLNPTERIVQVPTSTLPAGVYAVGLGSSTMLVTILP